MAPRPCLILAALFAAGLWTGAARGENSVAAPLLLVDHGVICELTIVGERVAPLTESGTLNLVAQDRGIDVTTRRVPARLGLSFGLRMRLARGTAPITADIVVTHPPLPSGVATQSWPADLIDGATALNVFTFEFPHELVHGRWTFRVLHEGRLLAEQNFDVVPPPEAPEAMAACYGDRLTS